MKPPVLSIHGYQFIRLVEFFIGPNKVQNQDGQQLDWKLQLEIQLPELETIPTMVYAVLIGERPMYIGETNKSIKGRWSLSHRAGKRFHAWNWQCLYKLTDATQLAENGEAERPALWLCIEPCQPLKGRMVHAHKTIEDDLLRQANPEWNKAGTSQLPSADEVDVLIKRILNDAGLPDC